MRVFKGFDELKAAVGEELGVSDWMEMTQDRINTFAEATGDHQWIHVDLERAQTESPYLSTIAHGFLTLALIPKFLPELFDFSGFSMAVNYGLNRVRFIAHVPVGAKLQCTAEIISVEELTDNALQITFLMTMTAEGASKPSCVAGFIARQYV